MRWRQLATSGRQKARCRGVTRGCGISLTMAQEPASHLYDSGKFGLIVAVFCAAILVLLVAGIVYLKHDQPRLIKRQKATGMVLVMPASRFGK